MNADAKAKAWADPSSKKIRDLLRRGSQIGWRKALRELDESTSFFVERMEKFELGNWQLLLGLSDHPSVLDVGCGFGSLTLGSSLFGSFAVGVDALSERVAFAALRARQSGLHNAAFVRGDGLSLPFHADAFDVVTLNGVLEWAGLYAKGNPLDLQRKMLEEAARLTSADGYVCVAIENSLAAETLLGLRDTHTDRHFLTALPEPLSSLLFQAFLGEDPRVRLHSKRGYERLFAAAGLSRTGLFNLIPSYNNYKFIIAVDDAASHRFVYDNFETEDFYTPAARLRRMLAPRLPGVLPAVAYSYLIVGQHADRPTFLEPECMIWEELEVSRELARFGVQMSQPGAGGIVLHRAQKPHSFVKYWPRGTDEPSVPEDVAHGVETRLVEWQRGEFNFFRLVQYRYEVG